MNFENIVKLLEEQQKLLEQQSKNLSELLDALKSSTQTERQPTLTSKQTQQSSTPDQAASEKNLLDIALEAYKADSYTDKDNKLKLKDLINSYGIEYVRYNEQTAVLNHTFFVKVINDGIMSVEDFLKLISNPSEFINSETLEHNDANNVQMSSTSAETRRTLNILNRIQPNNDEFARLADLYLDEDRRELKLNRVDLLLVLMNSHSLFAQHIVNNAFRNDVSYPARGENIREYVNSAFRQILQDVKEALSSYIDGDVLASLYNQVYEMLNEVDHRLSHESLSSFFNPSPNEWYYIDADVFQQLISIGENYPSPHNVRLSYESTSDLWIFNDFNFCELHGDGQHKYEPFEICLLRILDTAGITFLNSFALQKSDIQNLEEISSRDCGGTLGIGWSLRNVLLRALGLENKEATDSAEEGGMLEYITQLCEMTEALIDTDLNPMEKRQIFSFVRKSQDILRTNQDIDEPGKYFNECIETFNTLKELSPTDVTQDTLMKAANSIMNSIHERNLSKSARV